MASTWPVKSSWAVTGCDVGRAITTSGSLVLASGGGAFWQPAMDATVTRPAQNRPATRGRGRGFILGEKRGAAERRRPAVHGNAVLSRWVLRFYRAPKIILPSELRPYRRQKHGRQKN